MKSDELNDEVEATIAKARANGIQGSPVTIIDGKFKLDGVQTKDTFVQVCTCVHTVFLIVVDVVRLSWARSSNGWASVAKMQSYPVRHVVKRRQMELSRPPNLLCSALFHLFFTSLLPTVNMYIWLASA